MHHLGQSLVGERPQHAHGIVSRRAPQRVVEAAEDFSRVSVPGQPQVVSQLGESPDTVG